MFRISSHTCITFQMVSLQRLSLTKTHLHPHTYKREHVGENPHIHPLPSKETPAFWHVCVMLQWCFINLPKTWILLFTPFTQFYSIRGKKCIKQRMWVAGILCCAMQAVSAIFRNIFFLFFVYRWSRWKITQRGKPLTLALSSLSACIL